MSYASESLTLSAKQPFERCHTLVLIAEIEQRSGNYQEALKRYLEALELARGAENLALTCDVLGAAIGYYKDRGEYDEVVSLSKQRIEIAEQLGSKPQLISCYTTLGTTHYNRGDHTQALECYSCSLNLSSQVGDTKAIADSYINLGNLHKLKDELADSRECYTRAIKLYSRVNDQFGMARGMSNLAAILDLEGRYNEALDYAFRALRRRRSSQSSVDLAFSYYRIGKIYQSKGELDKALSYAERSLRLRKKQDDKLGAANSQLQIAEICLAQGDYTECYSLWHESYRGFQSLKNRLGLLFAREVLARLFLQLGRLVSAERILENLSVRARELQQSVLVASCLLHLGRISRRRGNVEQAHQQIDEAKELFRKNSNQRGLVEALLEKSCLELDSGASGPLSAVLDETYARLERLGIRDLVPQYFLIRGRWETMKDTVEAYRDAKKSLTRGLTEAQQAHLRDLEWQFHHNIGLLEEQRGDPHVSVQEYEQARAGLQGIATSLSPGFQRHFYELEERQAALQKSRARPPEPVPEPSPEPTEPRDSTPPLERDRLLAGAVKLHEMATLMGQESDLRRLLESVLDSMLELVDAERAFVFLSPGETAANAAAARTHDGDEVDIGMNEIVLCNHATAEVFRRGEAILAKNVLVDERFLDVIGQHPTSIRSLVCLPMQFRGSTLGAIYLDNSSTNDAFSDSDLRLLVTFADQAAVAVTNARLLRENEARHQELIHANEKLGRFNQKLRQRVHRRSVQLTLAHADLRSRQMDLQERYRFGNIIGRSRPMQLIYHLLEKVSATNLPVLIEGESGTGKELIARAIHFNSLKKDGRFVSESCSAVAEGLVESEWFGHVRGAFTGASEDKDGIFASADRGTLFLDQIDGVSMATQQKLLRVIQEGEFRRVGAKELTKIDVRFVASTDHSLYELVEEGLFREDLYYRLNGVRILVPALRERRDDIPLLVHHFCSEIAEQSGSAPAVFSDEALKCLGQHDWPGNVRELRSVVEKAVLIASGKPVERQHILLDTPTKQQLPTLKVAREQFEKSFLQTCLESCGNNVSQAARNCGVSRETLYRLLRKHKLKARD